MVVDEVVNQSIKPITEQNMKIMPEMAIIIQSITFSLVLSVHFRWNAAGKVKAIGVQLKAPRIDRKLEIF